MSAGHGALLLAGGRSERMGRDKALLEIAGEPLWKRQVERLVAAGAAEVVVSVVEEEVADMEEEVVVQVVLECLIQLLCQQL